MNEKINFFWIIDGANNNSHKAGATNCVSFEIVLWSKVVPDLGKPIMNRGFIILIFLKLKKIWSKKRKILFKNEIKNINGHINENFMAGANSKFLKK